jgi:hypothetical protein
MVETAVRVGLTGRQQFLSVSESVDILPGAITQDSPNQQAAFHFSYRVTPINGLVGSGRRSP